VIKQNRAFALARDSWLRLVCSAALVAVTACGTETPQTPDDNDGDEQSEEVVKPGLKSDAGTKPTAPEPEDDESEANEAPSTTGGKKDAGGPVATNDAAAPASPGTAAYCAVKPVLEQYCTACHDGEGTSGSPMGLTKPEDFSVPSPKTKGKSVAETVSARTHDAKNPMPPKGLLKEADLAKLDAWIAAGAPAGDDPTCAGAPTDPAKPGADGKIDGWNPEECDEIYEIRSHATGGTGPYNVPPGQEIHPQIPIDAPWGDETVQAIGFRPYTDKKEVLHHWILNGAGRAFLAGWAPGDDARPPFPKDVGMAMPKGKGAFTLDMHYNSLEQKGSVMDNSGVDICVLKGANMRPKIAAVMTGFASIGRGGVLAPAGAKDAPITGTCQVTARETVHLLTAAPHAHTYATRMKFTVTKKDGKEIVMHDQPFGFGEQGTYPLEGGEVLLETGDVVKTNCYYTNTTNRNITFGESTTNEMCFNFALYYPKGALSCGGGLGGGGVSPF